MLSAGFGVAVSFRCTGEGEDGLVRPIGGAAMRNSRVALGRIWGRSGFPAPKQGIGAVKDGLASSIR